MWLCRIPAWLNALSHTWHLYGLSPVWTLMCLCRFPDTLNALPQVWQLYGFSPLWVLPCLTRLPAVVNRFLQLLHSNCFSSVWIRLCTVNAWLRWQHFPHSLHLYLLVCVFICCLKKVWVVKRFSHWLHEYNFTPVCLAKWCFKYCFLLNRFSHTVHTCGLGLSSCSVTSLLSASVLASMKVSPVQYAQHQTLQNANSSSNSSNINTNLFYCIQY